jgi:cytochrome b561
MPGFFAPGARMNPPRLDEHMNSLREQGIHSVLTSFTDLHGVPKGKLVPLEALPDAVATGAGFAGPSIWGTGLPRILPTTRTPLQAAGLAAAIGLLLAILAVRLSICRVDHRCLYLPKHSRKRPVFLVGLPKVGLPLMAAVPLLGLATLFLRGRGLEFGLFSIASPLAANRTLSRAIKEVHELAAYALLALVAFHIAAALWHQFIKRDGLMGRMSFSRPSPAGQTP